MKGPHGSSPVSTADDLPASVQATPTDGSPAEWEPTLRQSLHERLLDLSFPAFGSLVQQVLLNSGYSKVRMPRRVGARGRTAHGGLDMTAYTTTDLASALTIVQVKQYRRPVSRRFVDELRGTMLRVEARQGLLVATSTFSRAARRVAAESEVAPIRLVDGAELVDLLRTHHLGVRQEHNGYWTVDSDFFDEVVKQYPPQLPRPDATARFSKQPQSQTNQGAAVAGTHNHNEGGDMTWSTHVLFGVNALWLMELLPPGSESANIGLLVTAAALGALLPDLDAAESKLKHLSIGGIKPFFLPSVVLHRELGHRGLSHSLSGLIILSLLAVPLSPWWGWPASLALVLGYASHLAADACTKSGIPFLYPRKYRYHLLPQPWRFTTGSEAEEMLFPFLAMAVLLLLLSHHPGATPTASLAFAGAPVMVSVLI